MIKLNRTQVVELRNRKAAGESLRRLAEEFGITFDAASRIWSRKTWAHIKEGAKYRPHNWQTRLPEGVKRKPR